MSADTPRPESPSSGAVAEPDSSGAVVTPWSIPIFSTPTNADAATTAAIGTEPATERTHTVTYASATNGWFEIDRMSLTTTYGTADRRCLV